MLCPVAIATQQPGVGLGVTPAGPSALDVRQMPGCPPANRSAILTSPLVPREHPPPQLLQRRSLKPQPSRLSHHAASNHRFSSQVSAAAPHRSWTAPVASRSRL